MSASLDDLLDTVSAYESRQSIKRKGNVLHATCESLPFRMSVSKLQPACAERFGFYVVPGTMVLRLQRTRELTPSAKLKKAAREGGEKIYETDSYWQYASDWSEEDPCNADFVLSDGDALRVSSKHEFAITTVLQFMPLFRSQSQTKVNVVLVLCKSITGMTFRKAV
jgi:hypothetical protein